VKGVNKAIIIGSCGKDAETRYTAGGKAITTISVATSESWKDKATGEKKEETTWHNVKFFDRLAEIAGEYLKKGSQVYIDGKIKTDKYTDKAGVERYSTYIVANEMQMLGVKPADSGKQERPAGKPSPQPEPPSFDDESAPF